MKRKTTKKKKMKTKNMLAKSRQRTKMAMRFKRIK